MNYVYHNSGAKIVKFNDMALFDSLLFKKLENPTFFNALTIAQKSLKDYSNKNSLLLFK